MSTTTPINGNKKLGLQFTKFSLFALIIVYNLLIPCQSHFHEHVEESPSFKYSKEANEHLIQNNVHDHNELHKNHDHQHSHFDENEKPHWRPVSDYMDHIGDVFIQAMGSTFLISIVPFLALYFVPLDNSKECEPLLKILLSFASGGLLGDAFLHLIPHALSHESHHHGHVHNSKEEGHSHETSVGLCVLSGIVVFLLVEKTVHLIKGGHSHSHHASDHKKEICLQKKDTSVEEQDTGLEEKDFSPEKNDTSEEKENDDSDNLSENSEDREESNDIKVAGYLNLAADFLHNFTDGLAIGASYLAGNTIGYVTSLTILLHEVPHEIGDFAILIQSGCSKPKAIMLQLVTAVGALLGTFISLLVGGMGDVATKWILPFTAGGFIYIATVSVIPELLVDTKFWQSVKEITAILIGVYMMVLVAEYE